VAEKHGATSDHDRLLLRVNPPVEITQVNIETTSVRYTGRAFVTVRVVVVRVPTVRLTEASAGA
jgi:hypothetical protein